MMEKTSVTPSGLQHQPALDGVRGVAILWVMAFHYFKWKPESYLGKVAGIIAGSGWAGVDLFFVLSGFLITSLLLVSRDRPHYFRNFYARRILRIFPVYYLFLLLFLVILPFVLARTGYTGAYPDNIALAHATNHQVWYWSFLANFHMAFSGQPGNGLSVVWSLSIEEQFYLIWPMAVYFLSGRKFILLCVGVILAVNGIRALLVIKNMPMLVYHLPFTRFDGLAMGALVAVLIREQSDGKKLNRIGTFLFVLVSVTFGANVYHTFGRLESLDGRVQIFGYGGLALLFGALILMLVTATDDNPISALLGNRLLRFFGKYSYALYLFHLPVFLAIRAFSASSWHLSMGMVVFLSFSVSIASALLSWKLIEKPANRLKQYFKK